MNSENCIFCQIIERKIPAKIIFETDTVLAFLDIFPISEGHTIVISKNHYVSLQDIPNKELGLLYNVVKDISQSIHKKLNVDGYNILQNNFKAAGQVINHFHVHIIPRVSGDRKLKTFIPEKQSSENELNSVLSRLKSK